MSKAAEIACKNKGNTPDKAKFLEMFEELVKKPVRQNPELLRSSGWR